MHVTKSLATVEGLELCDTEGSFQQNHSVILRITHRHQPCKYENLILRVLHNRFYHLKAEYPTLLCGSLQFVH